MSFKFFDKLSQDFSELLNDKKEYNVVIEVDQEENKKCFTAHSVVLRYRSPYFDKELENATTNENHTKIIIKPKISAQIFKIILKYIYSGIVDNTDTKTIYELMVNANELELKELSRKLESYLIEYKAPWLRTHFSLIYHSIFNSNEFKSLKKFYDDFIVEYPTLIFESEDFTSIQETALISILKRDDLKVEEIKIWDYIIKWGIAQNPTLPTNLQKWSNENFKALKTILQQCLPLIRYFHIPGKDIWKNVKPYKKILEEQLWDDLTQYFMFPNQPVKSLVLPARIISTPELPSRNISTPEFPFSTSPNQKHNSLPTTTSNDDGNYMNIRQGNTQSLRMKQLPPPPYEQATPRTSQQVTSQLQSIGGGNTINKVQSNTYPNPLQNTNLPPSQLQPQNHPIFNNNFYVTGRIPILPSQQHQQQLMQQQHQQQLMRQHQHQEQLMQQQQQYQEQLMQRQQHQRHSKKISPSSLNNNQQQELNQCQIQPNQPVHQQQYLKSQSLHPHQISSQHSQKNDHNRVQFLDDGTPVQFYVKTLCDYKAGPDEISFTTGDIIPVIKVQEDGWWIGEVLCDSGKVRGLFPSNYTEIFKD
ncbi:hypothetical protein Glove_543g85 [Diversispora epigaea]|uniref:BTB domain-containing protein n=1 Tax=Diversispora epigaea TaxID=1348612 RepID=A0A397GCL9_9GLOM|nr:hypothetical protein Glove_543g85 [Diversispora epigaea]